MVACRVGTLPTMTNKIVQTTPAFPLITLFLLPFYFLLLLISQILLYHVNLVNPVKIISAKIRNTILHFLVFSARF